MLKKLVLTGARGNLGTVLREPLSQMCETLVTTDIRKAPDDLLPNEHYVQADLSRMDEIEPLLKGADMVIHFGAIVDEKPFEELLGPNFVGATTCGRPPIATVSNAWSTPHRSTPSACIRPTPASTPRSPTAPTPSTASPNASPRISAACTGKSAGWNPSTCASSPARPSRRTPALGSTWLSYGDLVRLVTRAIDTPTTGFTVIYGVSANTRAPVSNARVPFLGYQPQDNAEVHAPALFAKAPPANPQDLALTRVGGPFAAIPWVRAVSLRSRP